MSKVQYRGTFPATLTPFTEDGRLDLGALENHLGTIAAATGIQGLVVNGHIGEQMTLTTAERQRIVSIALGVRRPGQPVIAAIEARTPTALVAEALAARDAGAEGLLVLPPLDARSYRRLSSSVAAVMPYFEALDAQVGLPLVVHQYPEFTGCAYSPAVLREMVQVPSLAAIKAASVNVTDYVKLWDEFHESITILAATDGPGLLGMLLHGSHGLLIGIGVIDPATWSDLFDSVQQGRLDHAQQLFRTRCLPLMSAVFQNQLPVKPTSEAAAAKEALVQLGLLPNSYVRQPAAGVTDADRDEIHQALVAARLLTATAAAAG